MSPFHESATLLFTARASGPAVTVILLVLLARSGGAEQVGLYGLAAAVFALLEAGVSLGLRHLLAREFAKREDDFLLGSSALVCLTSGVVLGIGLTAVVLSFTAGPEREILLLVGPALPLSGLMVVAEGYWIGRQKVRRLVTALLTEQGFRLITGLVVLRIWPAAVSLVALIAVGRVLAFSIAMPKGRLKLSLTNVRTLRYLRKEIPLFLGLEVVFQLYWRVDVILLALLRDRVEVGFYVAAYRIFSGLLLVPQSYGQVLLPRLMNKGENVLRRATMETAAVGLLLGLGIMAAATTLIDFLYGGEFSRAGSVLMILAVGLIPASMDQPQGRALVASGRQDKDLSVVIVATIINIVLNLFLIPSHGAIGAAYATVVSLAVSLLGHMAVQESS